MAKGLAEVVEATGDQHDLVSKPRFGVAKAVFDDPYPLHSCQNVLDGDRDLADQAIMFPFLRASLLTRLLLARLGYEHSCGREGLNARILMQLTVSGKAIGCSFRQGFVVNRTRCRLAQEADFSLAKVADHHIFMRVRFFYRCSARVARHRDGSAGSDARFRQSQSCGFHTWQARVQVLPRHAQAHAAFVAGLLEARRSVAVSTRWPGFGPCQTAFLGPPEAGRL